MSINYSYLRIHTNTLRHSNSYIKQVDQKGIRVRRIFYFSEYDAYQLAQITKLKAKLKEEGIDQHYDDAFILRLCYASNFDLSKCIINIRIVEEWQRNPSIQTESTSAMKILQQGIIYTHGRDYDLRPIIIVDLKKINVGKFQLCDYYCAVNNLMKPILEHIMQPGKIQNWVVIIDGQDQKTIPIAYIRQIIIKFSAVYACFLQKMYIVNISSILKALWTGLKQLIPQDTQKKIEVLESKQLQRLFKNISEYQLEKKFKGKLQNLTSFWPIKNTFESEQLSTISFEKQEDYISIYNNGDQFVQEKENCCGQSCLLF